MIPKVIHYCWFGHNKKSPLSEKCIASWKEYCPDYIIKEWNEDNFDIDCCAYVKEAYEAKKWAFVSDYARLWIIYNEGGIYLDTDVEIVRSLDDLLVNKSYFGFENVGLNSDESYINTGLGFGAEIGNKVVGRMLQEYDGEHFIYMDGSYNLKTCPIRNMHALESFLPAEYSKESIIRMSDATLYPAEYFCPLDARGIKMSKTTNTYSIHWYSATWLSEDEQVVHRYRLFCNKCERLFGKKLGNYIARGVYLLKPQDRKVLRRM